MFSKEFGEVSLSLKCYVFPLPLNSKTLQSSTGVSSSNVPPQRCYMDFLVSRNIASMIPTEVDYFSPTHLLLKIFIETLCIISIPKLHLYISWTPCLSIILPELLKPLDTTCLPGCFFTAFISTLELERQVEKLLLLLSVSFLLLSTLRCVSRVPKREPDTYQAVHKH